MVRRRLGHALRILPLDSPTLRHWQPFHDGCLPHCLLGWIQFLGCWGRHLPFGPPTPSSCCPAARPHEPRRLLSHLFRSCVSWVQTDHRCL